MQNRLLIFLVIIAVGTIAFLLYASTTEAVYSSNSESAFSLEADPVQLPDSTNKIQPLKVHGTDFRFAIQASYKIDGLLVSKHRYRHGWMKDISPFDYALVWGKVPDYLPYLKFSQAYRYCMFNYKLASPVDKNYVERHLSNNHLIPANNNIRKAFKTARKHDIVQLEGYLVNVTADNKKWGIGYWNTSLQRNDTGDGACEIIYVTRLQVGTKVFE
jgi:hypothetical protein